MKPLALLAALIVLGAASGIMFFAIGRAPAITVTEAALHPMGNGHALTLKIDNPGPPDRLLSVASSEGATVALTGAGAATDGLPIPGGSAPSLAMDGAHAMVMGLAGTADEGRLVPVTLTFADGGQVGTRARITGGTPMDYSAVFQVPADEPQPALALLANATGDGWTLTLQTTGFTFSRDAVDGPHQPGTGHGHVYLDGLKLARVYGDTYQVGPLPPGPHEFRVTLNTNDHRAYAVGGRPVTATVRVVAD